MCVDGGHRVIPVASSACCAHVKRNVARSHSAVFAMLVVAQLSRDSRANGRDALTLGFR